MESHTKWILDGGVSGGQVLSLQFGSYTDDQHLVKPAVQACIIALDHDWVGREPLILPLGYGNLYGLPPQYPGPTLVIGECLSHLGVIWGYSNKM